jgi:periplasmic divalent cation tolerance protein
VWCPFPDAQSARSAIAALLDQGLIACANILGPVESHFVWQGERATSSEVAILCKTTGDCLSFVVERLGLLHPYDTPAIMGWFCEATHPASAAWLASACAVPNALTPGRASD